MSTPDAVAETLALLERDRDIAVVAAHDVGSRAWGLAGPASDYDVGVLFRQDPLSYATVDGYRATIEGSRGDVELRCWNVKRFGELLVDSNPTMLEFLHSPLRYREHPAVQSLRAVVTEAFTPIRLYHHYRSIATTQHRKYLQRRLLDGDEPVYVVETETAEAYRARPVDGGPVETLEKPVDLREATVDRSVKRNLFALRAALYARYVLETHEFPTLDFPAFLDEEATQFEASVVEDAWELVRRKKVGEGGAVVGDVAGAVVRDLPAEVDPDEHAGREIATERVDAFIRQTFE